MRKITAVLIVLLLGTAFFVTVTRLGGQKETPTKHEPTGKPTQQRVPDGWKPYSDEKMGISFAVPPDYTIEQNGESSVLAAPPVNNTDPAGNTRFFYVSVIPVNLNASEGGEIYNYSASFYKKLLALKAGEIKNLSDNEGQKEWYMYERAANDFFNGQEAKVFINQRPWEFPNGTWEYRYVFEYPAKTVIAGAYIEGGPSDAPFTLPVLTQIMNTLQITQ